jgi:hypothetical protein
MTRRAKPNIGTAGKNTGAVVAVALAGILAGCSSGPDPEAAQRCPRVAVVADAALAEQFRPGPGRDLTDLASRAQIIEISGGCAYDEGGVTVTVNMPIVVERGPALSGGEVEYAYFVAVTDLDWNVIAKRTFPVRFRFDSGSGFAAAVEELEQAIPLQSQRQAAEYQVLIGFDLDREQLRRNLSN